MKKETKFYATASCDSHTIKKGEKFEIINFINESPYYGRTFEVMSKITTNKLTCLENKCHHLNGGNWKITEE